GSRAWPPLALWAWAASPGARPRLIVASAISAARAVRFMRLPPWRRPAAFPGLVVRRTAKLGKRTDCRSGDGKSLGPRFRGDERLWVAAAVAGEAGWRAAAVRLTSAGLLRGCG